MALELSQQLAKYAAEHNLDPYEVNTAAREWGIKSQKLDSWNSFKKICGFYRNGIVSWDTVAKDLGPPPVSTGGADSEHSGLEPAPGTQSNSSGLQRSTVTDQAAYDTQVKIWTENGQLQEWKDRVIELAAQLDVKTARLTITDSLVKRQAGQVQKDLQYYVCHHSTAHHILH
ncbi:hypothetical protein DL93DRAFT_240013 [Clavulina sp. PMI_390]|nr:hypothetical protein DL93DRAFT_240013 [Clavulina sp. PMI_390]